MAKYNINSNIVVKEIGLEGGDNDRLVLHQIFTKEGSKIYIKDILIKYDGKVIVKNYRESIPFLITLKSFTKRIFAHGDENKYFQYAEQKMSKDENNQKIRKSLNCKFDRKKYISFNDAFIIIDYIEKSMLGYSPIKLNMGKTILDINSGGFVLDDNNKPYPLGFLFDRLDDRLKKSGININTENISDNDDKLSLYLENI